MKHSYSRKIMIVSLIVALSVIVFAGCSKGGQAGTATSSSQNPASWPSPQASLPANQEPLEIT